MLLRDDSPYFSDEHRMIREQIRRFIAERVIPTATPGKRPAASRETSSGRWVSSAFSG